MNHDAKGRPSVDERDSEYWTRVEEATELLQENRYPEALLELRNVIKEQPNNPYGYYYLGVAFFETKNMAAARDAFRAALKLQPNYLGARVSLSNTLRILGETREALAQAKEALRRFPKDGDAMYAAGMASAAMGQRGAAKKQLEGFLDDKPELEMANEVRQILERLGLGPEGEPFEVE